MFILAKNLGIQGAGSPAAAEGRCSGCQRSQRPTTATGAVKEPYRGRAAAAVLLRSTLKWWNSWSFQTKRMGTKKISIFDFLIVAGQVRRSPEVAVTKKYFLIKKFLSIQNWKNGNNELYSVKKFYLGASRSGTVFAKNLTLIKMVLIKNSAKSVQLFWSRLYTFSSTYLLT